MNIKHAFMAIAIAAMTMITLAGCDKREASEYYRPTDPSGKPIENPGEITIIPDTDATDGTKLPTSGTDITITWPDGQIGTVEPGKPADVAAGTYQVVVVTGANGEKVLGEGADKLHLNGTVVSLTPDSDGKLQPAPEVYGGVGTLTVKENKTAQVSVKQSPLTRCVEVIITVTGLSTADFSSAQVKLYGVSNSINIAASRSIAETANYYYTEAQSQVITTDRKSTLSMRLLGIDTTKKQALKVAVTTKAGATANIEADVTALLASFNSGAAADPVKLYVEISFGIDGVTGTVSGWDKGESEVIPGQ